MLVSLGVQPSETPQYITSTYIESNEGVFMWSLNQIEIIVKPTPDYTSLPLKNGRRKWLNQTHLQDLGTQVYLIKVNLGLNKEKCITATEEIESSTNYGVTAAG